MLTKAALPSLLVALALALALACDVFSGPADLSHAVATFLCGPADGPATAITLASEPIPPAGPKYPFVQITILEPLTALAGRTWPVVGNDTAWAIYATGPSAYETASLGRVVIDHVDPDSTVHGEVSLQFASRRVIDSFSADWLHRSVLCG